MNRQQAETWLMEHECDWGDDPHDSNAEMVIVQTWRTAEDPDFAVAVETITGDKNNFGFSDEYSRCSDCGRILRTSADGNFWTPDYWLSEDGLICSECLDPEEYIDWATEQSARGIAVSVHLIDPEEHGFTKIADGLEHGLHEDMADDPRKIGPFLSKMGYRVLFVVKPSQFYSEFDCYVSGADPETVRSELFLDPEARYPRLKTTFREYPTPANQMKRALRQMAH